MSESDLLEPGEPVDLTNCDREPIHIPGAIQPHGVLLTLREPELIVAQASENVAWAFGRPASETVGSPVEQVLGHACAEVIAELAARPPEQELPVTPVVVTGPDDSDGAIDHQLKLHRSGGLLVCELEPRANAIDPTMFVREVSDAMVGMQGANGVTEVSQRAAEEIKRLTGYHRVMVYRFDDDGHGEVIAEAREEWLGSFLGQHYPATDIPPEARELYLRQRIRLIVDVDYEPSVIWPRQNPVSGEPLDLGLTTLRSVSPIHLQYLRNMGVTGTMTISLTRDGELWGMIACHHYSPLYVDYSVRAACQFVGEMLSFQFAREEESDLVRERAALRTMRTELLGLVSSAPTLAAGLRAGVDLLVGLCNADGVSVLLDGERITAGQVPDESAEATIVARLEPEETALAIDRLPRELPELAPRTDLCGALVLPLPRGVGRHIVWYRREWRHVVTWGGDPSESMAPDMTSKDPRTLSPRRSFEGWSQAVIERSRPWRTVELEAATELTGALAEHMVSAMRDQLAHVALHDPLTGLPNRTLLMESLQQLLRGRAREEAAYVGLLFLDVDNFKLVNDSFGHRAGDLLLQQVAERINSVLRKGDLVGRLGGDEFVVVLRDVKDPTALELTAARIQTRFEAPFELETTECSVTTSIGVAWSDLRQERSPSDVLRDADTAMYEAKRRGRGRSVKFQASLDDSRRRRTELERHLQRALDRGELVLEYQPLFTADGAVASLEALARWHSEALGRVEPTEFIPIAEEIGLIEEIGEWVLEAAFTRLSELRGLGADEVSMAVNLSARQLGDVGLAARIEGLLDRLAIPHERATVEITEGMLIASSGPTVDTIARIRALGVQVAIDDFGTGFSSLAYLRRLPADILKIDRAFIAELGRGWADQEIVGAVVGLARRLGIRTVAEGVETPAQLAILRELHCDLMQGFLLARPLPSEQVPELLARGNESPRRA